MFLLALYDEVTPYYRESMAFTLTSLNSRLGADAAVEAVAVISHLVFSTVGAKYTVTLQRAACDQATTEYMRVF